jgi:hypothetical protein
LEVDDAFGSREVERANTLLQFTALVHMAVPHSTVPDIPGALQYEPALGHLKQYVANLLQMRGYRYVSEPLLKAHWYYLIYQDL